MPNLLRPDTIQRRSAWGEIRRQKIDGGGSHIAYIYIGDSGKLSVTTGCAQSVSLTETRVISRDALYIYYALALIYCINYYTLTISNITI